MNKHIFIIMEIHININIYKLILTFKHKRLTNFYVYT